MAAIVKNLSTVNSGPRTPTTGFGDACYLPEGQFGPRFQADYQLVALHMGELRVTAGGRTVVVTPGSVALLLPGQEETWLFCRQRRTHHTWVTVHPRHVPALLQKRLERAPQLHPQSRTFDLIMKAAFSIRGWRGGEGQNTSEMLGLAAFSEYVRMSAAGAEEVIQESPVERARLYMEVQSAKEKCLYGAARAAGVTPSHLIRLFRVHYRTTPARHLWQLRVERGAGLLTATGLTVGEIAEQCGFKNPFHFSRKLREFQGVSPRELRRQEKIKRGNGAT